MPNPAVRVAIALAIAPNDSSPRTLPRSESERRIDRRPYPRELDGLA
jgi:hypothetical protein